MFNREKIGNIYKWWLSIDSTVFMLIGLLIIFGIVFISIESLPIEERLSLSKYYFLKKQIFFAILAFITITFISILRPRDVLIISLFGYIVCILLLIIILAIAPEIKGSRRWISFFGFSLQPSEIIKPFFIVLNAFVLSFLNKNHSNKKITAISFGLCGLILILLYNQPDMGMLILIGILFSIQLFLAMLPLKLFVGIGTFSICLFTLSYLTIAHFSQRINTFVLSLVMNDNTSYQVSKSLEAFSSGGILGKGPLEGVVKNSLPDAHTDFIFSAITEEFGLIFAVVMISMYFFIALRVSIKALDEKSNFSYLSLMGLISYFIVQASINIGVTMNILPTKGMTLPFLSYGGSSMLAMSICFGFILVFTKRNYQRQNNFGFISYN